MFIQKYCYLLFYIKAVAGADYISSGCWVEAPKGRWGASRPHLELTAFFLKDFYKVFESFLKSGKFLMSLWEVFEFFLKSLESF